VTPTDAAALVAVLDVLGYPGSYCDQDVSTPGGQGSLQVVAYFQEAPRDLRTSAIACDGTAGKKSVSEILNLARGLATPFALIIDRDEIALFRVGAEHKNDERLTSVRWPEERPPDLMMRALSPEAIRAAKYGTRQLTLFPIDVTLLDRARSRSVETLTTRVQEAYVHATESSGKGPGEVARLVIGALAAVIVRDKYRISASSSSALVDSVMARHGSYFEHLATLEGSAPELVAQTLEYLAEGFDYSAVDARTINRVYENLLVTPEVRKALGIFYTPPDFAERVLAALPIETIVPGNRSVFDPSCGSGNLLLAAIERLELLMPGAWSPVDAHAWMNTHVSGCDVDPVATEIARLSMLVSSLPLGNNWAIENRDFIADHPQVTPTVIVSNPPWRNPTGKREEAATRFLARSLDLLSDGGLLACVLPVTWLTGGAARRSRESLGSTCELFEVWRLPRDVFDDARYGAAVVFCRKTASSPDRKQYAFRWVGAGSGRRKGFLEFGHTTYSGLVPLPAPGEPLVAGPVTSRLIDSRSACLGDVANVVSGVVQRGRPRPTSDGRYRFLPRGAGYVPYSAVSGDETVLIGSGTDIGPGERDLDAFKAPQVLVQAHRSPDTAWRVRPVLDLLGVIPSDSWHAVIPNDGTQVTAHALLALLASSVVSAWVHSEVATKRIPKATLEAIPLPESWTEVQRDLAALGRQLVRVSSRHGVLEKIEALVTSAYRLTQADQDALAKLMTGATAPEGGVRVVADTPGELTHEDGAAATRPGAVLAVDGSTLRLWVLGGPDEGLEVELPERLPGFLAVEGSVFDIEGSELADARYRFHRAAYRSEEELFGLER
jgi:hypothetical protein